MLGQNSRMLQDVASQQRSSSSLSSNPSKHQPPRYVMKPFIQLTIGLFALLVAGTVSAGKYELIKGKGVEVCEMYERNLNFFNYESPMRCTREISPTVKDLKKPKVKEMDLWENRDLVRKIDELYGWNYFNANENFEEWVNALKRRIRSKHTALQLLEIDIDNDGKTESVLKYYDGKCESAKSYAISILVATKGQSALDIGRSEQLFRNPGKSNEYVTGNWLYAMYDVFSYKNEAYFDRWSDYRSDTGVLRVFKAERNRTKEVCVYRYHDQLGD